MRDEKAGEKSKDVTGKSVRWTRYDLVNGVVAPAKDAELQKYDPWYEFRENAGRYRTVSQPYVALLELSRKLEEAELQGIRPSHPGYHPSALAEPIIGPRTKADELILDWCNQHGLLGLVSVLSDSIRFVATDANTGATKAWHHFRDGGSWYSLVHDPATSGQATEDAAVTWFDWKYHLYEEKSSFKAIELFFRPIWKDEPLSPPRPNTREFWNSYGEPIQQFEYWCRMFASAVDCVSHWEGGTAKAGPMSTKEAHWLLAGLAQAAAPSFQFNLRRNEVAEVRVSAGLLASYALMFLWDRIDGRRALRCRNCGSYFVSDERRARYCTPTCRNTAQSRRYRSKKEATS